MGAWHPAAAAFLLLAACERAPTYAQAAPILARRCAACHGGSGSTAAVPPSLDDYSHAARLAGAIALAVQRREMPPWGPDATGLCGTWRDPLWLDPAEIATLSAWAERGAPAGDAAPTPIPPEPTHSWIALDPGVAFTPRPGAATRCFAVALGRDLLVTTVRGAPPAQRMALYALDETDASAVARLDGADGTAGWSCAENAPGRLILSWSWSTPLLRMPEGTGVRVPAGVLVLQVRYHLAATGLASAVRPSLDVATGRAREARLVPARASRLLLPPRMRRSEATASWTADRPAALLGVVPRMRSLGRVLEVKRARGTALDCLAYFGHWDVGQEQLYAYARPVALARGDRVTVSCTFDTSGQEAAVTAEGEECLAHLYLVDQ
jgi:hypothetical protein